MIFELNSFIEPRFIFKNGNAHKIISSDHRFNVYTHIIKTNKYEELTEIVLVRAFHPNAKESIKEHESFKGVASIYLPPKNVYLCIPDVFKGKKFGKLITKKIIENLISNWNFDDCYYMPHPHLYTCSPKL